VHEGDSAAVLPRILDSLDQPTLFWLDAHPCSDRSVRDAPVPLLAELAAIAGHRVEGHVILIDDMRLMGRAGYPDKEELLPAGYRLEQIGDVGVLTRDAQPSRA
jgi:hypothetical protein